MALENRPKKGGNPHEADHPQGKNKEYCQGDR